MSPEYAMGGIFSEKSDVFSFGVLILEIVSGTKNTSFQYYDQHLSLIGCVSSSYCAFPLHLFSFICFYLDLLETLISLMMKNIYIYIYKFICIYQAWHLWSESRGLDMVDKAIENSFSLTEAMRCIHVALLCVQDQAIDRPTMPDVVFMLGNETDCPQPKQPLFTLQRSPDTEFPLQNDSKFSNKEVTMSILKGR